MNPEPKKHSTKKPARPAATDRPGKQIARPAADCYLRHWRRRLKELAAFRKEHGHCCVSTLSESHASLGYWVRTQRGQRRRGELSPEQIGLLDKLGFVWDAPQAVWPSKAARTIVQRSLARWEAMYDALAAYQEMHGHGQVPACTRLCTGLARWVIMQRRGKRIGTLSAERIRRLDELGFSWDERGEIKQPAWEVKYAVLTDFRRAHGHCRVPRTKKYSRLKNWVFKQRVARREGRLSAERVRRLDELGFSWGGSGEMERINQARWEAKYSALAAYRRRHGHCRVPFPSGRRSALAAWVSALRHARRHRRLSAERIRRLDELGFCWDAFQDRWERRFAALEKYQKAHGDCNVPANWGPDPRLARWLNTQSLYDRRGKLPPERKKRLQGLGFQFGTKDGQEA